MAGWYEVCYKLGAKVVMYWFDGRFWRESVLGPRTKFGCGDNLKKHHWRGVVEFIDPKLYGRYVLHPTEQCNVRRMLWDYRLMGKKYNMAVATDPRYKPWPRDREVHVWPRAIVAVPALPLLPRLVPLPEFREFRARQLQLNP